MNDHDPHHDPHHSRESLPNQPRYKVVVLEMIVGDDSFEGNEPALDTVDARMMQVAAELQGVRVAATPADREQTLIDPDANRDHEAEARIAKKLEEPLAEIVANARARDHLRKAGKELNEAARLAAIEAHIRAEAMLRDGIAGAHKLWEKYVPTCEEIVRELIVKEAIKASIWVGLVVMAAKLVG